MVMPTKWDLTLPVLKICADGGDHPVRKMIPVLAVELNLSQDEKEERLKSGERRFNNRVRWAAWVLTRAGLLNKTGVGTFRITDGGHDVLKSNPTQIHSQYLMQIEEYREAARQWRMGTTDEATEEKSDQTPEEVIESAHRDHNSILAAEILDTIKSCSPGFFEQLVIDLLIAMGYGGSRDDAGEALGRSGDGGVDGIIKEDMLGLDSIYIQAKRWEGSVGADVVRNFVGALALKKAKKGIIITTSAFSKPARESVKTIEKKVALIDGKQLTDLMIEYNVGVAEVVRYSVKRIDPAYFQD